MRKRTIALLLAFTMMLSLFTPLPAYAEDEANDAPNLELGAPEGTDDVDSETCTHEYGDWIIDTEPQVGTDGLKHRECALCGNTESEVIPPLKEDETSEEDVPPADTETPPAQPDPAPGKEVCDHEYGEWQLRKEPTMDEAGSQFRVCQLCGEEEEERIPALSEVTNGEGPHGDGVVYCPHGHVKGETCYECGALTHSDKNIPMLGYDMDFFAQHMPPEDVDEEDLILYSLFSCRLICRHGVADGLYCDACGGLVNVQAEDIPSCWWFDSCMHGKIRGEKCYECQELKESQGDYELMEGEEWDDPLIYGTETMKYVSDISYIFNQYRYCIWCDDGNRIGVSRMFNDAWNVLCHVDSNGKYHWDYINRVEGSGTCSSHDTTIVYNCGARERTVHHSSSHRYKGEKTEYTETLSDPTCQVEGKNLTYYTSKCINCGAEGPVTDKKTVSIPKLSHLYTGTYSYLDSSSHVFDCSGNNTEAHQGTEKHSFTQSGEDYHCTHCDAAKTTVHIDAYCNDTLVKADIAVPFTVEVGHDGPETISMIDHKDDAYTGATNSGFLPLEEQNNVETVQLGGVHLKYYVRQLASIEVKDYKETYYRTDDFVDQGTIIVHYTDGGTEEVPLVKDNVLAGFDTKTVGTKTLTVGHNGLTTTCDIEVLWIPAKIKVEVPEGYAQSKIGNIVITGDGDFVTMPDGSTVSCGEVDTYLFTENGDFPFTVTGMDKGTDTDTVHMDLIDTEAPILTAELKDGKLTISSYDDLSGLKDITYLEATDTTAEPLQHIGEENKKTLEASVDGVADGVYRIVATDHAGNSRNFDFAINVETEPDNTPFSMYVPSSISFYVDKEGAVTYIPEDTQIYNYPGEKPISIKAITVSAQNDWTLVDYDTDFSQYEEDSAYVALSINGNKVNPNGTVRINVEDWVIAEQSSLPLVLDIKVPAQSESRELSNVMNLNFTGDWYAEGDVVGQKQTIAIQPDDRCSLSPNVTTIYTNSFGKITYLPRIVSNNDWISFNGWVNADTDEKITVGQVLTQDITIKPLVAVNENYIKIDFVAGEHGSISGDSFVYIKKGTLWKNVPKPTIIPDKGYELQGWYNEQEVSLEDATIVNESTTVTVTFASNPSNGLVMSVAEATAEGFAFEIYEDGVAISGFTNTAFKANINVPEQIGDFKVLKINNEVFKDQTNLKSISLPDTISVLGTNVFKGCSNLNKVFVSQSVETISDGTFANCSKLTNITIPNSVVTIGKNAFDNCTGLTNVTIPNSVTSIKTSAFNSCTGLTNVIFSDSVTSIGSNAFNNCTGLTNVTVPANVTSIGSNAFKGCSSLSLALEGIPKVGAGAFNNTKNVCIYGQDKDFYPLSENIGVAIGGAVDSGSTVLLVSESKQEIVPIKAVSESIVCQNIDGTWSDLTIKGKYGYNLGDVYYPAYFNGKKLGYRETPPLKDWQTVTAEDGTRVHFADLYNIGYPEEAWVDRTKPDRVIYNRGDELYPVYSYNYEGAGVIRAAYFAGYSCAKRGFYSDLGPNDATRASNAQVLFHYVGYDEIFGQTVTGKTLMSKTSPTAKFDYTNNQLTITSPVSTTGWYNKVMIGGDCTTLHGQASYNYAEINYCNEKLTSPTTKSGKTATWKIGPSSSGKFGCSITGCGIILLNSSVSRPFSFPLGGYNEIKNGSSNIWFCSQN